MRHTFASATLALSLIALLPAAHAADLRQFVEMPPPMQEHMLTNMRDHLAAMGERFRRHWGKATSSRPRTSPSNVSA